MKWQDLQDSYTKEQKMVTELADKPFVLLGVYCENQQVLEKLIASKTVTWRSWADGAGGPICCDRKTELPTC